jgi:hypothetical protein
MLSGLRSALSPSTTWVPPSDRHADSIAKTNEPAISRPSTAQSYEIGRAKVLRLHSGAQRGIDSRTEMPMKIHLQRLSLLNPAFNRVYRSILT